MYRHFVTVIIHYDPLYFLYLKIAPFTDVEDNSKKNPRDVMQCLQEYLQDKKSSSSSSSAGNSAKNGDATKGGGTKTMDFAGVHELDEDEDVNGVGL